MKRALLTLCLAGCAAGPQPIPAGASAADRLAASERALLNAKGVTGTFDIESQGENPSQFAGNIELGDGNALKITAVGSYKSEAVQLELDSRDSAGTNRSTTKGPSVSSHRDPPTPKLREAVALGLSRMGLLHNLVALSLDRPVDKAEGGADAWVKAVDVKSGAAETLNGVACTRVEFGIALSGQRMGEASVCIADATGLPIARTQTMHFPSGDMTETETFTWKLP